MSDRVSSRFRTFLVKDKVRESATITSFYFVPQIKDHWRPFEAGQFLTLRVPKGDGSYAHRNYTISSPPHRQGLYRISVKRETAPLPNVPDGLSSCWLHDALEPGMEIAIDGPHGAFKLNRETDKPVILLSGGVGLTPTVSMLHVLTHETSRPAWFIHACDGADVHALRSEVDQLAQIRPGIHLHYCYRCAQDAQDKCHSTGLINRQILQSILPLDDYEVYMCGPPPFMQTLYQILIGLGVRREHIFYEFFGPASLLTLPNEQKSTNASTQAVTTAPKKENLALNNGRQQARNIEIRLHKSGKTLLWDGTSHSLLEFLESQGIEPEFSCRAGICSTCEQGLIEGQVEYFEEPLDEVAEGRLLLCCTRPQSSLVLDL